MKKHEISYITKSAPRGKRVLLRVDFNVTLTESYRISDDARIKQALPTIKQLLENNNKIILLSHLGRPEGWDPHFSLKKVARRLTEYLSDKYSVKMVENFESEEERASIAEQKENEVIMLENMRFWEEESACDLDFAKKLAAFGDVYVNDAFGVSHREDASVVAIPKYLPSYGGLLLEREIEVIKDIINNPSTPVLSIVGGAKIETKVPVISKLLDISDTVAVGGAIANTFLLAQGYSVGKSVVEHKQIGSAKKIIELAKRHHANLLLPVDVVVGSIDSSESGEVVDVSDVPGDRMILDIGPETEALFGESVARARTIIWNGPVGYNEVPQYSRGTDFLFYSIAGNEQAKSLVGGGDTISSISEAEHLERITHISTGGGAMLEFLQSETLPGIEALKG